MGRACQWLAEGSVWVEPFMRWKFPDIIFLLYSRSFNWRVALRRTMVYLFQVPLLPRCSWRLRPAWQDFPCDRNSYGWDLARSLSSSKLQTTQNVLLQTPNSTRGTGRQKPSSLSPRLAQVWSLTQLSQVWFFWPDVIFEPSNVSPESVLVSKWYTANQKVKAFLSLSITGLEQTETT